jgi:hypothetical protein
LKLTKYALVGVVALEDEVQNSELGVLGNATGSIAGALLPKSTIEKSSSRLGRRQSLFPSSTSASQYARAFAREYEPASTVLCHSRPVTVSTMVSVPVV